MAMPNAFKPTNTLDQPVMSQFAVRAKSEADRQVSTSLAKVNIRDLTSVQSYGSSSQTQLAKYSDEILSHVKTSNVGEMGGKLVDIVSIAKELNVSDLNGTKSSIPFIGGLIDKFTKNKDKFVAKFNTLSEQIDKVVGELATTSTALSRRIDILEGLHGHCVQQYKDIEVAIEQGNDLVVDEKTKLSTFIKENSAANDPLVTQNISDWDSSIKRFEKRLSDLHGIQMMAVQSMPTIRTLQTNNALLIEKFKNANELTIPSWKQMFVIAVSLDEQKQASKLATTVDDFTNELYKKNADLLKQNSVEVAKSNQRSIIDIESLEYVQQSLISTFDELRNIEKTGEQNRRDAAVKIEAMKTELHNKLVVNA
jgi:uncharacterized protein YaaN involved in tellurite resistance